MIMKYFFLILFCVELIFSQGLVDNCFDSTHPSSLNASGNCQLDINCEGWVPDPLKNQISRSIVKILLPDCSKCTGTLLSQKDVATNDFKYYILTANHCIKNTSGDIYSDQDFLNTRFVFNYQRSGCNALVPGENGSNVGGQDQTKGERYFIKGARLVDHSTIPDFALLEITSPIPPHYNPYFSGWSNSPFSNFNVPFYGIHHPRGDVKSISRSYDVTEDLIYIPFITILPWPLNLIFSYIIGWTPLSNNYIVKVWSNGGMEHGSSGSALLNGNGRVIGTCSGNPFDCLVGMDYYGKFSKQWLYNQGLRRALNPNYTGLNVPIGIAGAEVSCYRNNLHLQGKYFPAKDYQPDNQITIKAENQIFAASIQGAGINTGSSDGTLTIYKDADFVFEAGNVITLLNGFSAENGSNFHAKIQACSSNKTNDYPESDGEIPYEDFISSLYPQFEQLKNEEGHTIIPLTTFTPSPNPFSTTLDLNFSLPNESQVQIRITDALGVLVYTHTRTYDAGEQKLEFDTMKLPSGMYFVQFSAGDFHEMKKVIKN